MSASVQVPRSPKGHPLWGHSLDLNHDQIGYLSMLAAEYGDVVPLRLPPYRAVFFNGPDLIDQVLVSKQRAFRKGIIFRRLSELGGQGLITSESDYWRRQRNLIQPNFHRQHVAGYGQAMVNQAQSILEEWHDGEEREIQQEMLRLTLNIVCNALFSVDVKSEAIEIGKTFDDALHAIHGRTRGFDVAVPAWVPLPTQIRLWRARRRLDKLVYRIIRERRAGEERPDLVSMLLAVREEGGGGAMTDLQIRDEIMTFALAGHETTALALTWSWYLLAQHPEAVARLHAEVDDVLGGRLPTLDDLPRLTYVNWIISEAMRLYPPAWALPREAIQDVEIGGYQLRKGTLAIVSQWTIQRDGRVLDRPLEFEPERWKDDLARRIPRYAYFPFGGGPRQCIGIAFAMMEAALLIACIAQKFRMELVPGQTVGLDATVTLRAKAPGIKVKLHKR